MNRFRQSIRRFGFASLCAVLACGIFFALRGPGSAEAAPAGGVARVFLVHEVQGTPVAVPGGTVRFVVTISNSGGTPASGARLVNAIPAGISEFNWQCIAIEPGNCATSGGTGAIDQPLDGLSPSGTLIYEIDATVSPSPPPFITSVALTPLQLAGICDDGEASPCRADATVGARGLIDVEFTNVPAGAQAGGNLGFTVEFQGFREVPGPTILRIPLADGISSMSWTCNGLKGMNCPLASGTGPVEQTIPTWPQGGSLAYTFNATVSSTPPLEIAQSAIAIPPYGGLCGFDATLPPCTAVARVPLGSRILLSKLAEPNPPSLIIYTIQIENAGADAGGSVFTDAEPLGVTFYNWTCSGFDGAICPQEDGVGAINQILATFPPGGRFTYQVTAEIQPSPPATVTNTASVVPPAGGRCGFGATAPPCIAAASTGTSTGGVSLEFLNNLEFAAAGQTVELVLEVGNTQGVLVDGSTLEVPVPPGIAAFESWTCIAIGPAICADVSGTGPISTTIPTLPSQTYLSYTIQARVDVAPPVEIIATATLTPAVGGPPYDCDFGDPQPPCVATQTIHTAGQVMATKSTTTAGGIAPGDTIDYELYVTNLGADVTNLRIVDALPAGIVAASWVCSSGYVSCPETSGTGAIDQTVASFPQYTSVLYYITATVDATPPSVVTNTMSVTGGSNLLCFDASENLTAPPCVSSVSNDTQPLLDLSLTSAQTQAIGGSTVRYTLTVRNRGTATGLTTLADPLPAGVDRYDWQCRGYAGATCPADSGSGALAEAITALPANGRLVYTIDAGIDPAASGTITHFASLTPPPGAACNPSKCSVALVLPVSLVPAASIDVTKTTDTVQATPGSPIRYTINLRNLGPVSANNVQIADPVPAGLTGMSWTCFGVECPAPSGSGPLAETLPLLGGSGSPGYGEVGEPGWVVYTVDANVAGTPPPTINNIATVTPSGSANCAFGICTSTASVPTGVPGVANLVIGFDNLPPPPLSPGQPIIYSIAVTNTGSAAAGETMIDNPVPTGLEGFSWSCTAGGGVVCPVATGNGAINAVVAEIPTGGSIRFDVDATVVASPPPAIVDTVVVDPPVGTVCDPASCSATLNLPVDVPQPVVLNLTKTADRPGLDAGGNVTYTVTLTNTGAADANPSTLSDPLPAGLTSFAWTCAAINGATCPAAAGTGGINATVALPGQSSLVYTVQAIVATTPPPTITNTATLAPGGDVTCTPACTASVALPVQQQGTPAIVVDKQASPASGTTLAPGQAITWTLRAANTGSASTGALTLVDSLPANVSGIAVSAGAGTTCGTTTPAAGSDLVCTIPAGFTGQRSITITATVTAADAQGQLRNTLAASGVDAPLCSPCATAHPVVAQVDISVGNARPFSAAGVSGTLVDIVNLSSTAATALVVIVEPASAIEIFGVYSNGCTATPGAGGSTVVSCPVPPSSQGIQCSADRCTIQGLPSDGAATLFVALRPQTSATLRVEVPGDTNPGNNSITLPVGGNP